MEPSASRRPAVGPPLRIALGAVSGVLAGLAAYVFLEGLDRVTRIRLDHGWLVWFLPVAGLGLGLAFHHFGSRALHGSALLVDEIHTPTEWIPRRLAPLVLVGTWVTHLFGGSAGREGTAVQMSGGLTDLVSRVLRLDDADRTTLLVAALAGGFGAVFGVPVAGVVFALEVQSLGRRRWGAILPAAAAAFVGDAVVAALGYDHPRHERLAVDLDAALLGKIAIAGFAFGIAGTAFVELTHAIRSLLERRVSWPPARPVLGGVALVGLVTLVGRDWLGLSLPLLARALDGEALGFSVFALKILFTAVTLGCAFPGGEVTPLFVIGATLGAALGAPLGTPTALLAVLGFVAVFAGAANTPLAGAVMGVELFGTRAAIPFAVACAAAYLCSGHRGIYPSRRRHRAKRAARLLRLPTGPEPD